jgi:hypothetical protein
MTDNQHQATVHKIANKVDRLIMDVSIRARFTEHIDRFCKVVEDYGQALQPYAKKLERAEKRIEKFTPEQLEKYKLPNGTIEVSLVDVCPPQKDWIKMSYTDNFCVKVPMSVIRRPREPVNPLLWFGIFGNAGIQRKPTENEKLMCEYVLLAAIHDGELQQPTDRPLFSDKYDGKWFLRDDFRERLWSYYFYDANTYPSITKIFGPEVPESESERLLRLNRALEHVLADPKPAETGENVAPVKGRGIKAFFWKLYETTVKAFFDSLLGKSLPK